jgi:hypothetical protein
MHTTHADITDGTRQDITVEFISQRTINCDGKSVQRLLVADNSDTQFTLLVAPERGSLHGLQTGEQYRVSGLLGAAPVVADSQIPEECPECGGKIRSGSIADAVSPALPQAAEQLSLDALFGIIDTETTFQPTSDDDETVDDWVPMDTASTPTAPEYVCTACSRQFDERDPPWRGG